MTALLLFPGAGSSSQQPSLVAIEHAVAPMACRRADFPYRLAGRRAPDRPPVLMATVRQHAAEMGPAGQLVMGGRSMGGRICSMVAGDLQDPLPVAGLVLICYPLHPPGKPETLRVAHFPQLSMPCLFISGTRDTFGSPEELERWTATIPGPVTHHWLTNKGHDLKGCDAQIADLVAAWISELPPSPPRRRRG